MEHFITILNDDDLWTDTQGTNVKVLSLAEYEMVLQGADPFLRNGLATYDLTNPVHLRMLADRIEANRRRGEFL